MTEPIEGSAAGKFRGITLFQSTDSDCIYAPVGSCGSEGIFCLHYSDSQEAQWKFRPPGSPSWDFTHQDIYFDCRVREIADESLLATLPELPEVPMGPWPPKEAYYLPATPLHTADFPGVGKNLDSQPDRRAEVVIVLHEDTYETSYGDGKFLDFSGAFFSKQAAEEYMQEQSNGWYKFYLRTMTIALKNDIFQFPDFALQLFDHYKPAEALESLEKTVEPGRPQGK